MKHILPIIIAFILLVIGCGKDKEVSEQTKAIEKQKREQFVGDSLFSVYGVKFTNAAKLTRIQKFDFYQEVGPTYFFGLNDGNPWVALYDRSNNLLAESTESIPDSIWESRFQYKDVKVKKIYDFKNALIIDASINNNVHYNDPIADCIYYYDKKNNTIRRYIYGYGGNGYTREISISAWYNDSFLLHHIENYKYKDLLFDKDFNIINKFTNEKDQLPTKAGLIMYPNTTNTFPISFTEYFSIGGSRWLSFDIVKSSINSFLNQPPYPEPPYYSYELERKNIRLIDLPSNIIRLDNYKFEVIDHGDRLEVKIEGKMLLSDDASKSFYEEDMQRSVFIDKKTGNQIK